MQKNLIVAAYARVSTDKDDQANSLANQKKYFREYIQGHDGWSLLDVYYDEGISGTQTKKRAGFNRMISDAMNGRIDLILTKEVSRFARNTVDTLSYTRQLKAAGVSVIFTIDNINTADADGELRLTIMASIAQEESRKTSERVKWGQTRQMEHGVVFGRDLLGYTVKNGQLSINEEEASIVRAVFNKYTNEGKGTTVIARELLEEGKRPMRIALWSNTTVLRILRNEKYVGDLCQKKTFTPDYLTHAKKYNRGEEEKVYLENHHEPIISRDLWDRTQAELTRRAPAEEQKSKHSNRYWYSGKLRCAECGRYYVSRSKLLKNGTTYRTMRCHSAAVHGASKKDADGNDVGCSNNSISEKALLTCMSYCIHLLQGDSKKLKADILKEIKQIRQQPPEKPDKEKIQKEIDKIEKKKRKAIDLMLNGVITEEDLKKQTNWYNEGFERLNHKLMEAMEASVEQDRHTADMEQYVKALDEIMSFNETDETLYGTVLDHMNIHKGHVVDVWMKNIPVGIRLKIKSSGKMATFNTEILEVSYITNQDAQNRC